MSHIHLPETQTLLYATAESANHNYLAQATGYPVVANARELAAREHNAEHFVLVPACTSRDLTAITQAAQTLQWLKERTPERTLILAEPLSGDTYAIARMRHHIRALAGQTDALLFRAATINPFADAELLRRVRLARQFSENIEVEVAFDDAAHAPSVAWPRPETAQARLRKLGAEKITTIRADLYRDPTGEAQVLFGDMALRTAVAVASDKARHRAEHGNDGIAAGLLADHGAGFAHSHGDDHSHGHHQHDHHHGHSHAHHYQYDHGHQHHHNHKHNHHH